MEIIDFEWKNKYIDRIREREIFPGGEILRICRVGQRKSIHRAERKRAGKGGCNYGCGDVVLRTLSSSDCWKDFADACAAVPETVSSFVGDRGRSRTAADLGVRETDPRKLDRGKLLRLSGCGYIRDSRHIIIMGASGSGKTYLSNAPIATGSPLMPKTH